MVYVYFAESRTNGRKQQETEGFTAETQRTRRLRGADLGLARGAGRDPSAD